MDETTKGNEMLQVTIPAGWMKQAGQKLEEHDPAIGDDVPKGVKMKILQYTENNLILKRKGN